MFRVVQIETINFSEVKQNYVNTFICYENKYGVLEPHILTKYITLHYSTSALNTQKKYAEDIKLFLNFMIEVKGKFHLEELELKDAARYLRELVQKYNSNKMNSDTFYKKEARILHFYSWLSMNKLIKEDVKLEYKEIEYRGKKVKKLISPFTRLDMGVARPPTGSNIINRRHDFGKFRYDYITDFIKLTEILESEIALGVALQMFGGLRAGEVLNLQKSDVMLSDNRSRLPTIVSINDRRQYFETTTSDYTQAQVKKVREQLILDTALFRDIFNSHITKMDRLNLDDNSPLIFSHKTKKAISPQMYRRKFNKIRDKFLISIKGRDPVTYTYLKAKSWSTHIGRGIFTNLLKFESNLSDSEVRVLRGDSSLDSVLYYLEKINAEEKINYAVEELDKRLEGYHE